MIDLARILRFAGAFALPGALLAAASSAGAGDTDHIVTVVNKCKQQVWIGEFGAPAMEPHEWALAPACTEDTEQRVCGPSGTCDGGACSCATDDDCAFGVAAGTPHAKCDLTSGKCVRRLKLKMPPGWQGRLWPRTGCSGDASSFICETGQCGPESGGNIDCNVQNSTGNRATLFEIAAAGNGGADSYDVSLVSGFNIPLAVRVLRPDDAPIWHSSTQFPKNAVILERIGRDVFAFDNVGLAGQSGVSKPEFPGTWGDQVADGTSGVRWSNNGPSCQSSGCTRRGVDGRMCPSALHVQGAGGARVACDAPANACLDGALSCTPDELSYLQCVNTTGETDLFGKMIPLMSPNGASPICFVNASGASDCAPGTTCTPVTAWSASGNVGVCTPVIQNGGCESGNGQPCPYIAYPYLGYTCQTVTVGEGSTQVCAPPTTPGMGPLWWNADNWTQVAGPVSCTSDAGCGGSSKCLMDAVSGGQQACQGGAGCTCWSPQPCTSSGSCTNGTLCQNKDGVPNGDSDGGNTVNCAAETCYCASQAIYGGVCGPTNPGWVQAAASVDSGDATWPASFKDGCPLAYSYQYDDPSANWTCANTANGLNDYRLVFCGGVVR